MEAFEKGRKVGEKIRLHIRDHWQDYVEWLIYAAGAYTVGRIGMSVGYKQGTADTKEQVRKTMSDNRVYWIPNNPDEPITVAYEIGTIDPNSPKGRELRTCRKI